MLVRGRDFVHQCIAQREEMDWRHTRNVAIVALSFHGNFNYFWLRALEHRFPGRSARMILRKLLLDQTFASPLATSVFYTGVSFLEDKEDIFADWREKFFNTYKTGLMYWPFMQDRIYGLFSIPVGHVLMFLTTKWGWDSSSGLSLGHGPQKRLLPRSTDEEK